MRRIALFISFFFLFVGCKSGKGFKGLGGLDKQQFEEFNTLQSDWGDAHGATYAALGKTKPSDGTRPSQMGNVLKGPCGTTDTEESGSIPTYTYGLDGNDCAVKFKEQTNYTTGSYNIDAEYTVQGNSPGDGYQQMDAIHHFYLNGYLWVKKQNGEVITTGNFKILAGKTNDGGKDSINGSVGVSSNLLTLKIDFPTWELNAAVQWDPMFPKAGKTYTVQNVKVSEGEFSTAFSDFFLPDILQKMDAIPNNL